MMWGFYLRLMITQPPSQTRPINASQGWRQPPSGHATTVGHRNSDCRAITFDLHQGALLVCPIRFSTNTLTTTDATGMSVVYDQVVIHSWNQVA